VRVQTFNIGDDESSEEAFNNPVCLQGRVTTPCCGKVEGGQKRLFSNEQVLVWCLSADQRRNNLGVPADVNTCGQFCGCRGNCRDLLSNHKDLYLNREHGATAEITFARGADCSIDSRWMEPRFKQSCECSRLPPYLL
jgi:hypothetical protein